MGGATAENQLEGAYNEGNRTLNRSKKSFNWYKKVIESNGEDLSNH